MKNGRNLYRTRCRVRWAAAIAVGAAVLLVPSLAWSQDRGQPGGLIPIPCPGNEKNKTLTLHTPPFQTIDSFNGIRNFIPLPQPGGDRNKTLTLHIPPFQTIDSFNGIRNFIPLPQGGDRKRLLTAYGSQGGWVGSQLGRFVRVGSP